MNMYLYKCSSLWFHAVKQWFGKQKSQNKTHLILPDDDLASFTVFQMYLRSYPGIYVQSVINNDKCTEEEFLARISFTEVL